MREALRGVAVTSVFSSGAHFGVGWLGGQFRRESQLRFRMVRRRQLMRAFRAPLPPTSDYASPSLKAIAEAVDKRACTPPSHKKKPGDCLELAADATTHFRLNLHMKTRVVNFLPVAHSSSQKKLKREWCANGRSPAFANEQMVLVWQRLHHDRKGGRGGKRTPGKQPEDPFPFSNHSRLGVGTWITCRIWSKLQLVAPGKKRRKD